MCLCNVDFHKKEKIQWSYTWLVITDSHSVIILQAVRFISSFVRINMLKGSVGRGTSPSSCLTSAKTHWELWKPSINGRAIPSTCEHSPLGFYLRNK